MVNVQLLLRLGMSVALMGIYGCRNAPPSDGAPATDVIEGPGSQPRMDGVAVDGPAGVSPYPPGQWRTLPFGDLGKVAVWLSHILIRHRDSQMHEPVLHAAALPFGKAPGRSRDEALQLARRIAGQAALSPTSFPELARDFSDDRSTRALGGSLGGIMPVQLLRYPAVLDAIQALRANEVSQVVETSLGFHVLHRRPPPEPETVTGRRIVIAHDEAPFLREQTPDGSVQPRRSRSDAEALANDVYRQASLPSAKFEQLVATYSEHQDVVRGGDIGTWSTLEPSIMAREIEVLANLDVDRVAPPLDSLLGFIILQRTANRPRADLAMTMIELRYGGDGSSQAGNSRARAQERGRELIRILSREPSRFAEFQKEGCCAGVEQWTEGRGSAVLTQALLALKVGEMAREPVRDGPRFIILQRMEPSPPPEHSSRFALR